MWYRGSAALGHVNLEGAVFDGQAIPGEDLKPCLLIIVLWIDTVSKQTYGLRLR